MIIQLIMITAFAFVGKLVDVLPMEALLDGGAFRGWFAGALTLISNTAYLLPWDVIVLCMGSVILWVTFHMMISLVRAVKDFIPFMGGQ